MTDLHSVPINSVSSSDLTGLLMTHRSFVGLRLHMVHHQRWSHIRQPAGKMERVTLLVYLTLYCAASVVRITFNF